MLVEAFVDGEPLRLRDVVSDLQTQKLINVAAEIHAATGLSLVGHDTGDDFEIRLAAPRDFATRPPAARLAAAAGAFESLQQLRALYSLDAAVALNLRIDVEVSEISYTFDGTQLVDD